MEYFNMKHDITLSILFTSFLWSFAAPLIYFGAFLWVVDWISQQDFYYRFEKAVIKPVCNFIIIPKRKTK
jgi:hypothetical protein